MISDTELKTIVESEIHDAVGYVASEITDDRADALKYYYSEPFGDEQDGLSAFVSSDVSDVVETMMPSLMRVFTASDDVVEVTPVGEEDIEYAEQAQDFLNWVFHKNNPGFMVMQDVFRDALLSKVGVFKHYWLDDDEVTEETYEGLTEAQLLMLADDDEVEILDQTERRDMDAPIEAQRDPLTGMDLLDEAGDVQVDEVMIYDVRIRRTRDRGRIVIEAVPPEEFLISKRATSLEDAPFVAHQVLKTASDLVALGYDRDLVEMLPAGADLLYDEERLNRYGEGETPDAEHKDPSMREITVYECYIKIDVDEDGVATWRKVTLAGNEVLDNEPVDDIPFSTICPVPVPHKFFGRSVADLVMPLQRLKSVITRQMLDNAYMSNNARLLVQEGQAQLDDVLTNRAGGIIRVKNPAAVQPLPVHNIIGNVFPLLQYFDQVRDDRTIGQAASGMDANVLQNTTATAIAAMQQSALAKVELIARNFAETGVKRLFQQILKLSCQYETREKVIRLRNKFVTMDPSSWNHMMDVTINVGLGTNDKGQQMAMLGMIAEKQEQILLTAGPGNPLVGMEEYRNTLRRMVEVAGFKGVDNYIKSGEAEDAMPMPQPEQPPEPSPEQQKMMADIEIAKAKMEADIALKQQKAEADLQLAQQKLQAEMELKRAELDAEIALKSAKTMTDVGEQNVNVRAVV